MKPIKTARFGVEKGDFDYLYGEYKSLEEAKRILKYEGTVGLQFTVLKDDDTVDLYLWQGKDLEPLLVTSDEDEDGSGGNFNPDGENLIDYSFSLLSSNGARFKPYTSGEDSVGFEIEVSGNPYTQQSIRLTGDGVGGNFLNNISWAFKYSGISIDNNDLNLVSNLSFPETGYSFKIIPVSVNEIEADGNGNIQLTPTTLINILTSATEAEKTQIKSLLGIS